MGGEPDCDPGGKERLDLRQVGRDRRLAHTVESAALVGGMEKYDRDPGVCRCSRRGERLGSAEIVELANRRVPRGEHLAVHLGVVRPDRFRRCLVGLLEHPLAPCPEVGPGCTTTKRPLKGVAVAIDEAGKG